MATSKEGESRNPALDFLELIEAQLRAQAAEVTPEIRRKPLEVAADDIARATAGLPPDPYEGEWGEVIRWHDQQRQREQFIKAQPEPLKTFYELEKRQEEEALQLTLRGRFNVPNELSSAWNNILAMAKRPERPQGVQLIIPSYIGIQEKVRHGLDPQRTVVFGLGADFKIDEKAPVIIDESAILTRYYRKLLTPQDRLTLAKFR